MIPAAVIVTHHCPMGSCPHGLECHAVSVHHRGTTCDRWPEWLGHHLAEHHPGWTVIHLREMGLL